MCGIVVSADFTGKPVNNRILDQYFKQKHRGSDGFGLFAFDESVIYRTPHQKNIVHWLKQNPATAIMFHHRFPTSTANATSAAHPFNTGTFFKHKYILVHNGVLANAHTLKREHEELGIVYTSVQDDGRFNDSEALLWDVALFLEGKQTELKARGSVAFVCYVKKDGKQKLFYFRNDRPLKMSMDEGNKFILSSEGRGEDIKPSYLYEMDLETQEVTERFLSLPTYVYYGNYSNSGRNFMGFNTDRDADDDKVVDWVDKQVQRWQEQEQTNEAFEGSAVMNTSLKRKFDGEDIRKDIQDRYIAYMVQADGYYELAYEMSMEDREWLAAQIEIANFEEDREEILDDLFYELEIQGAVMGAFLLTTEWRDSESQDSSFDEAEVPEKQLGLFAWTEKPKVNSSTVSVQEIIAGKVINKKVKEIAAHASKDA